MFSLTCPVCQSRLSLTARRLLVQVDAGDGTGTLVFTCFGCEATSAVPVSAPTTATLVQHGVTPITLTADDAWTAHPEAQPSGPPLTGDDLIDLVESLADASWFDALLAADRTPSAAGEP